MFSFFFCKGDRVLQQQSRHGIKYYFSVMRKLVVTSEINLDVSHFFPISVSLSKKSGLLCYLTPAIWVHCTLVFLNANS